MKKKAKRRVSVPLHRVVGRGTRVRYVGNIAVCCMAPDYRACLDKAMAAWSEHRKTLPKEIGGRRYRSGVYAFAYWLIRWSGLVVPANAEAQRPAVAGTLPPLVRSSGGQA